MAKVARRTIPHDIVPIAYEIAKKFYNKEISRADAIRNIVGNDRIKETSAGDYLYNYRALVEGRLFERKLNTYSMDYFLTAMLRENGRAFLTNPLRALQAHIDYNRNEVNAKIPGMQRLHDRFANVVDIPELVQDPDQIEENLITFSGYLLISNDAERKELLLIVRKGIDFMCYKVGDEFHFAPAKFIGWKENRFFRFRKKEIHGTDAVDRINLLMDKPAILDVEAEQNFRAFCSRHNIPISETGNGNNERKFWIWENILPVVGKGNEGFPEGRITERLHKTRERDPMLVKLAKERFKQEHGKLFCQVCQTDFEEKYGAVGKDFIEAHHTIFVTDMKEGHVSQVKDMAMLCSNCHRMVHRKRPWLTMEKLSQLLDK